MGAAAKFLTVGKFEGITYVIYLHHIGIFFLEIMQSAGFLGFRKRHFDERHWQVLFYFSIYDIFHFLQFFHRHFARKRKIKTGALYRNVRSALLYFIPQYVAERLLEQVRCSV